jgi:hypothetical protein
MAVAFVTLAAGAFALNETRVVRAALIDRAEQVFINKKS